MIISIIFVTVAPVASASRHPSIHVAPAARQLSASSDFSPPAVPAAWQLWRQYVNLSATAPNNHGDGGDSSMLWWTVVRRSCRENRTVPPNVIAPYVDLRMSRLNHRNHLFRDGKLIFERAPRIQASLRSLQWRQATLRFALSKAAEDKATLPADRVGNLERADEESIHPKIRCRMEPGHPARTI